MDGTTLQDRYSRGMGAAARVFGLPYDVLRAQGPSKPTLVENRVLRMPAAFDGGDPGYRRPRGYEAALRGTFDVDCTLAGDYLVGPRGTLFIAAAPPLARPLCVLANRVFSVLRTEGPELTGLNGYGGVREPRLRTVLRDWPAAIGAGADGGRASIPNDSGAARWTVLLPLTPAEIEPGDLLQDASRARYVVRVAEWSEMGWRLSVREAGVG